MRLTDSPTTLAAEVPDTIPWACSQQPCPRAWPCTSAVLAHGTLIEPRPARGDVRLMGADESEPGNVNAAPNVAFRFRTRRWARLTSPISIMFSTYRSPPTPLVLPSTLSGRGARRAQGHSSTAFQRWESAATTLEALKGSGSTNRGTTLVCSAGGTEAARTTKMSAAAGSAPREPPRSTDHVRQAGSGCNIGRPNRLKRPRTSRTSTMHSAGLTVGAVSTS